MSIDLCCWMPGTAGTPKSTTAFFGTFTASLIPVLCSPRVSLPPPRECRCQTCTQPLRVQGVERAGAPGTLWAALLQVAACEGRTPAATRTLPCLCYKALHRADSHVCKGLPQALWMSNRGDEGLLFLAHLACTAACAVAVNHCPSGTALPPLLSWPKSGAPSLAACSSSRAGM